MGTEFQFCKMRKSSEAWMDDGDGHTIMQMCLTSLNYTLKNSSNGGFYVLYTLA